MPDVEQPQGQTTPEPQGTPQATDSLNYQYAFPDGEVIKASNKKELDEFFKGHYHRTADYTRKTQGLAKERAEFEKKQAEFQKQMELFQKSKSQYDEWDRVLRTRPEVYQNLQRLATSPAAPTEVFDRAKSYADEQVEALRQEIAEMKKAREAEAAERELMEALSATKQEFGDDFDEDRVRDLLGEITSGETAKIVKMLHYAARGMTAPEVMEKKIVAKQAAKKAAGLPKGGGAPAPNGKPQYRSLDEARDAALQEYAAGG